MHSTPQEGLPDYNPNIAEPPSFETANDAMQHYAKKVRAFMRDESDLNQLLRDREFSWESIYLGIEDALADWNSTPPLTGTTLKGFPVVVRPLLYMRAAVWLLKSASNQQARNQLSYSDQGWSVQEFDKAPAYGQIAAQLEATYEEKKLKYKVVVNAEQGWGGSHMGEGYSELIWGF